MKTRFVRRVSQVVFFLLFLFLVLSTVYTVPTGPGTDTMGAPLPPDLLVRIDPLVAGGTMLAVRAFIPKMMLALIVVAMTVLLGRVFCGWICPLGTTLDISDKLFYRKRTRRDTVQYRKFKYYLLGALFITALFSMQVIYMFDPLSLLTRSVVLIFFAPIQMSLKDMSGVLTDWSYSSFGPLASSSMWLSDRMNSWTIVNAAQVYFRQAFVILGVFAGIIALNSISRRFWCRNLCPLGALLGLLSKVPVLKRVVNSGCVDCGKCLRDCKMAAIPTNPRLTRSAECIECFNCVPVCPKDAEKFGLRPKPEIRPETSLQLSRRRLLQGVGAGFVFAVLAKVDPGRKLGAQATNVKASSPWLIRPPGSLPEGEFVNRCVRCGSCMKACPTGGLQPAVHEGGIEGFWTPILVSRLGACIQECNACGQVCPTEAIRPFTIDQKEEIFIGMGVIERDRCIAWNAEKECLVCDEYCSYDAIEWKKVDGYPRPFVDTEKCVGCGACENACPIQPKAAIRVYSIGDKRSS